MDDTYQNSLSRDFELLLPLIDDLKNPDLGLNLDYYISKCLATLRQIFRAQHILFFDIINETKLKLNHEDHEE